MAKLQAVHRQIALSGCEAGDAGQLLLRSAEHVSFSIPYVLRAVVEVAPHAVVRCGGQEIAVSDLNRLSADMVSTLLGSGYRAGSRHSVTAIGVEGTLERIASGRIGIILSETDQPEAPSESHLDVLEQRVWSETALIETVSGSLVTHGEFLTGLQLGRPDRAWPPDLVTVLLGLLSIGAAESRA